MNTPQRVLGIIGGAFLIATIQAMLFGPVVLQPANITGGVEGVKGDPNRMPTTDPDQDPDPTQQTDIEPPLDPDVDSNAMNAEVQDSMTDPIPADMIPSATFTGAPDTLLDAPVPEGSLTLRESHQLWEMGAYFLDARHEHEYEAGHIAYASYLESSLFDTDSERAFAVTDSIPTDATVVLYCLGGECDASKNTAVFLEQLGYTDLRIMGAGYDDWVAAGFETAVGSDGEGSP